MSERSNRPTLQVVVAAAAVVLILFVVIGRLCWTSIRIDVPAKHFAVLIAKTGQDIENGEEIAPDANHKGVQKGILVEGRHFFNPYYWDWRVYPMIEIPNDKMGVRIRLHGKDLPYGHFLASDENHKGIIAEVLIPGRYAINAKVIDRATKKEVGTSRGDSNDYAELVELWDPVVIPAGFHGVVTNQAGPIPENPNVLIVPPGCRGPQEKTLQPGTYYRNPYVERISAIDMRSQRFSLAEGKDMKFSSKDGFPISLDGMIEFRMIEQTAAKTFVTYNDVSNDKDGQANLSEEIIEEVILPNTRAFCRLRGSDSAGREFISGDTRAAFQAAFQKSITETCKAQGVEIVQALVAQIEPPQAIAQPLRDREVAVQQKRQYTQQVLQQQQEAKLAEEKMLIEQKKALVDASRQNVESVTKANQDQKVKLEAANRDKEVAQKRLDAAKDEAAAIVAKASARASVIGYENQADAAGWKKAVAALGNDGEQFARNILFKKLAPGYHSMMVNTADSPLMGIFSSFTGLHKPTEAPKEAKGNN